MKKIYYLLFVLILGSTQMLAQQDPQYSQFMFNKMYFNPAYAGSQKNLCISCMYRKQWIGIDRAPQTATLLGHGTAFQRRLGLGASLTYDQIGFTNRVDLETSYAYRIEFKNEDFLALGLRGSLYYMQIRWDQAQAVNGQDNAIPATATSRVFPNFGAGVYYQSKYWYVGLSVPHIFRNKISFSDVQNRAAGIEPTIREHYFLMGGLAFDLNKKVGLQTNIMAKYVQGAPFDMDINLSVVFMGKLLVGVTYRIGDAVNAMIRWRVAPQLQIAFSYDYTVTRLQQYNAGSLEVLLQYCFYKKSDKVNNPRFF